jgi:hypothetical protein
MWYVDEALLRSIVGLTHGPHPLQDRSSIDGFCQILSKALHSESFVAKLDATTARLCSETTEHRNAALLKACSGVCSEDEAIRIIWLPDYGSAVVCRLSEFFKWHINLVCLDEWSLSTHHPADYTSFSHGFAVLAFADTIADIDLFCKCFKTTVENAQQRLVKLKKKQNTPSVVEAALEDALSALEIIARKKTTIKDALIFLEENGVWNLPRGGFTDVGRHYGAERRDTCWPLVEGVFRMLLEWSPVEECAVPKCYELFSACLILWLTKQQLKLTCRMLNDCMEVRGATGANSSPRMGLYQWTHERSNGRQVYKHETRNDYLYHIAANGGQWMIGPTVGEDAGWLQVGNESAERPDEISGGWQDHDGKEKEWVAAAGVTVVARAHIGRGVTAQINTVMQLLALASQKGAVLSGDFGLEMSEYARQCTQYRQTLVNAHNVYTETQSKCFNLPSKISMPTSLLHLDVREPKSKQVGVNREQVEARAQTNINWLPLLEPLAVSGETEASLEYVSAIVTWLNHPKIASDSKITCQIVLRNVEHYFYHNVRFLETQLQVPGTDAYPEALMTILEKYRMAVSVFRTLNTHAQLRVEVMSRELLVVWIVKCLVDKSTRTKYQSISDSIQFGSALQWQDLRHLVLADKLAMDASLCVCIYLRHITTARPLFSLAQEDSTFTLAFEFASRDQTLKGVWTTESAAAAKRQEDHWEEVKGKQDLVRKLNRELRGLKNDESALESEIETYTYSERFERNVKAAEKNDVQAKIRHKKLEIKRASVAPDAIFQPLPARETRAMRVLFFLHMPKHFRMLSQVVLMAQQMLLPKDSLFEHTALCARDNILSDVDDVIGARAAKTSWLEYYNSHSPTMLSCETPICLWSDLAPPEPRFVYKPDVMDYNFSGEGIWHPDDLTPRMMWAGGGFVLDKRRPKWFNPFAPIPDMWVVENFTERLPGEASSELQWVLPQYGAKTESSRGNKAIASQHLKPFWLNKPQFLHFGVIRAFPQQQLRKLCTSLHDRDLPLVHPAIHTLFRQTLYHTGDICEDEDPTFAWKSDQLVTGKVLCTLHEELIGLARELRTTPRNHAAVLLLGEVAAYLSQWDDQGHADARSVAREFAGVQFSNCVLFLY